MQGIGSIILSKLVITTVDVLNQSILNAVCKSPDGLSEEGCIEISVWMCGMESEHNIVSLHNKFLDESSLRQELDGRISRAGRCHLGQRCYTFLVIVTFVKNHTNGSAAVIRSSRLVVRTY